MKLASRSSHYIVLQDDIFGFDLNRYVFQFHVGIFSSPRPKQITALVLLPVPHLCKGNSVGLNPSSSIL